MGITFGVAWDGTLPVERAELAGSCSHARGCPAHLEQVSHLWSPRLRGELGHR